VFPRELLSSAVVNYIPIWPLKRKALNMGDVCGAAALAPSLKTPRLRAGISNKPGVKPGASATAQRVTGFARQTRRFFQTITGHKQSAGYLPARKTNKHRVNHAVRSFHFPSSYCTLHLQLSEKTWAVRSLPAIQVSWRLRQRHEAVSARTHAFTVGHGLHYKKTFPVVQDFLAG